MAMLNQEQLKRLSDEDALELLRAYEAKHLDKCGTELTEYARYIEVPGAPVPLGEKDRIQLLRRKEALSLVPSGDGVFLEGGLVELQPKSGR